MGGIGANRVMPGAGRIGGLARGSFLPLALLYIALFGAFGMESPFFPSFLASRDLGPRQIAAVLAAGTIVRIVIGPAIGLLADRAGVRRVLACAASGAGVVILLYPSAHGFVALLLVAAIHSCMVSPLNPLCDALTVEACRRERLYPYGRVRGIGSMGYVVATVISGTLVARAGLASVLVVAGALFVLMLVPLAFAPSIVEDRAPASWREAIGLLRLAPLRRMLLVAALVVGSHAMSSTFAVIQWRAQGLGAETAAWLWGDAIVAEIVVFMLAGPKLLRRFGSSWCFVLAAVAGVVRWSIVAISAQALPLALAQALQGLTFALLHLACMDVIAATVPARLAATAQSLYNTLALGVAAAILTLASGEAYHRFGPSAFWSMAALCLGALPIALIDVRSSREPSRHAT